MLLFYDAVFKHQTYSSHVKRLIHFSYHVFLFQEKKPESTGRNIFLQLQLCMNQNLTVELAQYFIF